MRLTNLDLSCDDEELLLVVKFCQARRETRYFGNDWGEGSLVYMVCWQCERDMRKIYESLNKHMHASFGCVTQHILPCLWWRTILDFDIMLRKT